MHPPTSPFLVDHLFGLLTIRWYAICILSGAVLGAWVGARRAVGHGQVGEHAWNLLSIGLVISIACARAWYVVFEWPHFVAQRSLYATVWQWLLMDVVNPATGGIAIQGALVGAVATCVWYTRRQHLDPLLWLDIGAPCLPIGQALGRWGNFFNQEAYGRPMARPWPWGLRIDASYRIHEYTDLNHYPVATTRFHPTFLYESLWNGVVLVVLLLLERRGRRWLRRGDLVLCYGVFYSLGRFAIEGLRTDSLCIGTSGGSCAGGLRAAQVTALVTLIVCVLLLLLRHSGWTRPAPFAPAPPDGGA